MLHWKMNYECHQQNGDHSVQKFVLKLQLQNKFLNTWRVRQFSYESFAMTKTFTKHNAQMILQ